jgi:hypothetical protein
VQATHLGSRHEFASRHEYDREQQACPLVAHCGLDWNDGCLAFYPWQRPVDTASVAQVRQPIYCNSVGRWSLAVLPFRDFPAPLHTLGLPDGAWGAIRHILAT